MMYYMKSKSIIYRDFGEFGYITDNRNFGYKMQNDNRPFIGDKILSQSGSFFYSILKEYPRSIEEIVKDLYHQYEDVDINLVKNDAIAFYDQLGLEGFVICGMSLEDCARKDIRYSYKSICDKNTSVDRFPSLEDTTQTFFEQYFEEKHQLTNIHIEITSICNERCVHCYIPHDLKSYHMPYHMFEEVIEQALEMKVLHLTISGGEPLEHPDIIKILKKCREYNFSVNLLSNLTLLNDEVMDEIEKNNLICVQTSLYSMDESIHDEITQKKGSLVQTLRAINRLIDSNIPLQVSCPIMRQNKDCFDEVAAWGKENNINVNSDFVIIGQYDHKCNNIQCRLTQNDISKFIKQRLCTDAKYVEALEKTKDKKKAMKPSDYVCSVCQSSVCISERGDVYPCAGWQDYVLGSISDNTLYDIWEHSERANYLRELRHRDFPKCLECSYGDFCTMCMVRNANENNDGNPLIPNPYFCEISKNIKSLYETEVKNRIMENI